MWVLGLDIHVLPGCAMILVGLFASELLLSELMRSRLRSYEANQLLIVVIGAGRAELILTLTGRIQVKRSRNLSADIFPVSTLASYSST